MIEKQFDEVPPSCSPGEYHTSSKPVWTPRSGPDLSQTVSSFEGHIDVANHGYMLVRFESLDEMHIRDPRTKIRVSYVDLIFLAQHRIELWTHS